VGLFAAAILCGKMPFKKKKPALSAGFFTAPDFAGLLNGGGAGT
jgi:hypothetical protein